MCGIGGFSLSSTSKINSRSLANALLTGLERRGNQASGFAWNNLDGSGFFKQDIAGSKLSLRSMPKRASSVILHTRLATHGSIREMANNHPVQSPDQSISLVHNGVIYNHSRVRTELPFKLAEVDTAVIPAILQNYSVDKFSMLDGDAAVAWLDDSSRGILKVARVSHSPLTLAQLEDGSLVFASTEAILVEALRQCGLKHTFIMDAKERTLFTVRQGRIDAVDTLPDLDPQFEERMSTSDYKSYRSMTSGKSYKFNKSSADTYDYYESYIDSPAFDEGFDDYLSNFVYHEGFFYDLQGTYAGTEDSLFEEYERVRYLNHWSEKNSDYMGYTVDPEDNMPQDLGFESRRNYSETW